MHNLHQIALANGRYSTDNGGRVPGPTWRNLPGKGWLFADLQMDRLEDLETGCLWIYLQSYQLYRGPMDYTDLATVPQPPNNSRMITSYCMNGSVCRYGTRNFTMGADGHAEMMPTSDYYAEVNRTPGRLYNVPGSPNGM